MIGKLKHFPYVRLLHFSGSQNLVTGYVGLVWFSLCFLNKVYIGFNKHSSSE